MSKAYTSLMKFRLCVLISFSAAGKMHDRSNLGKEGFKTSKVRVHDQGRTGPSFQQEPGVRKGREPVEKRCCLACSSES